MKKILIILLSLCLLCQGIYAMSVPSQTIEKDCPKIYSGGYYKQDSELVSNR